MQLFAECETEGFLPDYEKTARLVLSKGLEHFACPYEAEISLYIVEEETIREMNREQRGIDRVTDVLSFPNIGFDKEADFSQITADDAEYFDPENNALILGEIVICANKVFSQAEEYGHSTLREYAFLMTHSLLHLLGFDHENDTERERMEAIQEEILKELGIVRETI